MLVLIEPGMYEEETVVANVMANVRASMIEELEYEDTMRSVRVDVISFKPAMRTPSVLQTDDLPCAHSVTPSLLHQ